MTSGRLHYGEFCRLLVRYKLGCGSKSTTSEAFSLRIPIEARTPACKECNISRAYQRHVLHSFFGLCLVLANVVGVPLTTSTMAHVLSAKKKRKAINQ